MVNKFISQGILKYFDNPYKLIVEMDNEILAYYYNFIPKCWYVNKPRYAAHISVIRNEQQIPNLNHWKKYDNELIEICYDSMIYNDNVYVWLNAYSPKLEMIRLELGLLPTSVWTYSPDGAHKFHMTIGNMKQNIIKQ